MGHKAWDISYWFFKKTFTDLEQLWQVTDKEEQV